MNTDYVEPVRAHLLDFLVGLLFVFAVGYGAYHWLWTTDGWVCRAAC